MDAEQARSFIKTNHHSVMATFRTDGHPAMSPMSAALDDGGNVVVSTRKTAMKIKHLRRDPRVALTVFTDGFVGPWVQVEGQAEIVELPEAMDLLVAYYRAVAGEHEDWADYRAAMHREQRVIIRFAIDRAGPNEQG